MRNATSSIYRYTWQKEVGPRGGGLALVITKYPSWPDEPNPTLTKVCAWARARGLLSEVTVMALFGRRCLSPAELDADVAAAVGPNNDIELIDQADAADLVIAAWGQPNGLDRRTYDARIADVEELVGADRLTYVGSRKSHYPLHPQRWSSSDDLFDWSA